MEPLLELRVDRVQYRGARIPVLADLELTVYPGEVVGIAGPTESGKTTLGYLLAGLIPGTVRAAASGRLAVAGQTWDFSRPPDRREWLRQVGLALSEPYYQLTGAADTVLEEIGFPLENLGVDPAAAGEQVRAILDEFDLGPLAGRSPFELSVGQQQRVVLAAVLATGPRVLVLDEAFEHLDPAGRDALQAALSRLTARGGAAVILSGRRRYLEHLANRAFQLEGGRLRPFSAGSAPPAERPPAAVPGPVIVQAEDLYAGYRAVEPVLRGVSFRLRAGETLAILGPNGAGKSTLLSVLLGLLRPWSGRVRVLGLDAGREPPWRLARLIGYLPQNPAEALFGPTVRDDVAFGPRNLGLPPAEVGRRADFWLAATGLTARAGRHPLDLGPGWRRLVALASILALETPILALDEPTVGLDDDLWERLVRLLERLKAAGRTIILVSQDLELAARLADRAIFLSGGQVAAEVPAGALLSEGPPAEGRPQPG
jgi:energy-coupling factor transport system ATP-binding protein